MRTILGFTKIPSGVNMVPYGGATPPVGVPGGDDNIIFEFPAAGGFSHAACGFNESDVTGMVSIEIFD